MIYDTIQKIARRKGLSVREVERICGFAHGTIKRMDTGKTISLPKVKAVAHALGVDPYTLLLVGIDMGKVKVKEV